MRNGQKTVEMATNIALCIFSALLLGISQPIYIPDVISEPQNLQNYLGLFSLVGYVPLFLLIHNKNLKQTFLYSMLSLSLYLSIVLYWIYIPVKVHGGVNPYLSILITYLLPLLLAFKLSIFLTIGRLLSMHFNYSFFIFAPLAICSGEYFRNFFIFGGFPWGNMGYSLGRIDEFLQFAAIGGVYGLVFIVASINALLAYAIVHRKSLKALKAVLFALLVLALLFYFGRSRLLEGKHEFAPSIRIAALQGNFAQDIKNQANLSAHQIIEVYKSLSEKAKDKGANLIIWPETGYPYTLNEDTKRPFIEGTSGVASVVGAAAYGSKKNQGVHKGSHYHNSAFLISYKGFVKNRYDKSHLVPFGEYVPWPFLGIVDKIVPHLGAWRPGMEFEPTNLELGPQKSVSVGATICYEGIFPEVTRIYAQHGADLLVNLTNDAWFETSSAPYQHFFMYSLRAVETGLPIIRATNTGISGIISPYGHVRNRTNLFERTFIIEDVPLIKKDTIYVSLGDIIPILCLLLFIGAYIISLIPLQNMIKERKWGHLLALLMLILACVLARIYFSKREFIYDESIRTKELLTYLISLLFIVGLSRKTKRTKNILTICAIIMGIFSVTLIILESYYFIVGLILSILLYYLAFRIKIKSKA